MWRSILLDLFPVTLRVPIVLTGMWLSLLCILRVFFLLFFLPTCLLRFLLQSGIILADKSSFCFFVWFKLFSFVYVLLQLSAGDLFLADYLNQSFFFHRGEGDGAKIFVSCIAFRDRVCVDITEAYRLPPNTYADKCICIVSHAPNFRALRDSLEEIFVLCFSSEGSWYTLA